MKISILIPCHNEEKSIRKCIQSCLKQTRKPDEILVVDDASTDRTYKILKSFGRQIRVVKMTRKGGNKSFVQEEGLRKIKGSVFITVDADTILDKHFVERVEIAFKDRQVMAFAGYVKSLRHNLLTACRELDYIIAQNVHKQAQSHINYLYVIPGCAGAFRTRIFKKEISFDHDTVTEDLDFTYKLHERNYKIVYDRKAIVYTQDPANFKDYIRQLRRWYGGGWQNLLKHRDLVLNRPQASLEITLVYLEGLLFPTALFVMPFINISQYLSLFIVYLIATTIFSIYGSLHSKRKDLLMALPLMPFMVYLQSYIFLEQFVKEVILRRKNMSWFHTERRAIA